MKKKVYNSSNELDKALKSGKVKLHPGCAIPVSDGYFADITKTYWLQREQIAKEAREIDKNGGEFTVEIKGLTNKSILQESHELVYGDRHQSYGDFVENMTNTANIVNAVLGLTLKASDMAMIMVCVKLAREKNAFKRDTATDACGYLDGYVRCKERENEKRKDS